METGLTVIAVVFLLIPLLGLLATMFVGGVALAVASLMVLAIGLFIALPFVDLS